MYEEGRFARMMQAEVPLLLLLRVGVRPLLLIHACRLAVVVIREHVAKWALASKCHGEGG